MITDKQHINRAIPAWAISMLTVLSFLVFITIFYFLMMIALYMAWFRIFPSSIPHQNSLYFIAVTAFCLSIFCSRAVNFRLRGNKFIILPLCPHCKLENFDTSNKICPQCGHLLVNKLRFFRVSDWLMVSLNFFVMWFVLSVIVRSILTRLVGINPHSPLLPKMVITLSVSASIVHVILLLRWYIKVRRKSNHKQWMDDRITKGKHCPCGYDLTGNESGVCSECGTEIRT